MLACELIDPFDAFSELLDGPDDKYDINTLLKNICSLFGVSNAVYLGVNLPTAEDGGIFVSTTYSDAWKKHYLEREYQRIDPVVRAGLRRIAPLDWDDVDRSLPRVRTFFGEAREFGVGQKGISYPIRGVNGEIGLFSVNSDLSQKEWVTMKRRHARDFQCIAFGLHNLVLDPRRSVSELPELTEREIDCLRWAAEGKTHWATAQILDISEKTVRFHLENAKVKLNCISKTHAVAKAVRFALV